MSANYQEDDVTTSDLATLVKDLAADHARGLVEPQLPGMVVEIDPSVMVASFINALAIGGFTLRHRGRDSLLLIKEHPARYDGEGEWSDILNHDELTDRLGDATYAAGRHGDYRSAEAIEVAMKALQDYRERLDFLSSQAAMNRNEVDYLKRRVAELTKEQPK